MDVPLLSMDIDTIVQSAKKKDPRALATIYEMYYPQLVRVCMRIVKEDKDVAHDLVHDAFILAFVSLDKLRDNERLGEWLTTIVRNVALKYLAQKSKRRVESLSSIGVNEPVVDSYPLVDSLINSNDILQLVAQLPEGYAKIFRLSVIEGFTHKEIADMLGIEPHSSSSQLSRAKRQLRQMILRLAIVILLLIPVSLYFILYRHDEQKVCDTNIIKEKKTPSCKNNADKAPMPYSHVTNTTNISLPVQYLPDIDEKEPQPMEVVADSTHITPNDTIAPPVIMPEDNYFADNSKAKSHKWQLLATGSLGPALAQNIYKLLTINSTDNNGNIGSEVPSPAFPEHISTWEDYSQYLHFIEHGNTTPDTLALMKIADNNNGEMTEQEQHEKPITFGISLTKPLNDKWSIETGIQYSLLNSQFTLGSNGYAIVKHQKIHYIGLPLRVSYRMMNYKRLSLYNSAGITLHLPVHGKIKTNYIVDWQRAYSDSRHISPSLQWATSLSLGLQYELAPSINIYVEPTINWFIPSGSDTHTIWTEQPLMFTSPLGIRITW